MKKELLEIYNQRLHDHEHKGIIFQYLNDVIDFYEAQKAVTYPKLLRCFEKYNYSEIHKYIDDNEVVPRIMLSHSYEMDFYVCLDWNGGISDRDEEIEQLVAPMMFIAKGFDYNNPNHQSIGHWIDDIYNSVPFIWLMSLWQEAEGWRTGIVYYTRIDGGGNEYCFNDIIDDYISDYLPNDNVEGIGRYFNRNLSCFEIYIRLYLRQPNKNKFRSNWYLFKREDQLVTLSSWYNEVSELVNKEEVTRKRFSTVDNRIKYLKVRTEELINAGYNAVIPNGQLIPFIHFVYPEPASILDNAPSDNMVEQFDIKDIEADHDIRVPFHFAQLIKLSSSHSIVTPIVINLEDRLVTLELYCFNDFKIHDIQKDNWLEFADVNTDEKLVINVGSQQGRLAIGSAGGEYSMLDVKFNQLIHN